MGAAPSFIHVEPGRCEVLSAAPAGLPARGYLWVDCHYEEPRAWVEPVQQLTGVTVLEDHLLDAENPSHPSYFDSTHTYEMIVFRGLAFRPVADPDTAIRIRTRPTVFFLMRGVLVSVRPADSHLVPAVRRRLLEAAQFGQRLPTQPEELMLRILNGMVDRYLDLRQPLTDQLEFWQRDLLDPRRPYQDWLALLEARRELRKLENLSEEQLDALQEWRDERLDRRGDRTESEGADVDTPPQLLLPPMTDTLEVRVNDLVEHIQRVLTHARRLESSVESAVQLHFSATAHRTNQIMRTLTTLTAIFMPLTLITGIFGMNFDFIPGLHAAHAFWYTIAAMAVIALALVAFFRTRRYLAETGLRRHPRRVRRRSARTEPDGIPPSGPGDTSTSAQGAAPAQPAVPSAFQPAVQPADASSTQAR